ncbi:MAG: hypothetical protein IJC67_03535, partial [Clostridia bacterium]|nr:hypothetical protein [Clostridia bacterium]
VSGNDGINTNEDNVSVTTINGGSVNILVNGATGEGDGIDSNGWLVINGGTVTTQACAFSGDAGIDSDMGIHINGGTVVATGNMLDHISESAQNYAVFQFAEKQNGGVYTLKNAAGEVVMEHEIENDFSCLIISSASLSAGEYTLWQGEVQLKGIRTENGGKGGMGRPVGMQPFGDVMPGQATPPEGTEKPQAITPPEGAEPLEGMERPEMPEGAAPPEKPDGGMRPDDGQFQQGTAAEASDVFPIVEGGNYFQVIAG